MALCNDDDPCDQEVYDITTGMDTASCRSRETKSGDRGSLSKNSSLEERRRKETKRREKMGTTEDSGSPSCRECKDTVNKHDSFKKTMESNLSIVKEKIVMTDELIKMYQRKCQENETLLKEIEGLNEKLKKCYSENGALRVQLEKAKNANEPLKKTAMRFENEMKYSETQVKMLVEQLKSAQNQVDDARAALIDRERASTSINTNSKKLEKENSVLTARLDKKDKEIERLKTQLNASRAAKRESDKGAKIVTKQMERMNAQLSKFQGNQNTNKPSKRGPSKRKKTRVPKVKETFSRTETKFDTDSHQSSENEMQEDIRNKADDSAFDDYTQDQEVAEILSARTLKKDTNTGPFKDSFLVEFAIPSPPLSPIPPSPFPRRRGERRIAKNGGSAKKQDSRKGKSAREENNTFARRVDTCISKLDFENDHSDSFKRLRGKVLKDKLENNTFAAGLSSSQYASDLESNTDEPNKDILNCLKKSASEPSLNRLVASSADPLVFGEETKEFNSSSADHSSNKERTGTTSTSKGFQSYDFLRHASTDFGKDEHLLSDSDEDASNSVSDGAASRMTDEILGTVSSDESEEDNDITYEAGAYNQNLPEESLNTGSFDHHIEEQDGSGSDSVEGHSSKTKSMDETSLSVIVDNNDIHCAELENTEEGKVNLLKNESVVENSVESDVNKGTVLTDEAVVDETAKKCVGNEGQVNFSPANVHFELDNIEESDEKKLQKSTELETNCTEETIRLMVTSPSAPEREESLVSDACVIDKGSRDHMSSERLGEAGQQEAQGHIGVNVNERANESKCDEKSSETEENAGNDVNKASNFSTQVCKDVNDEKEKDHQSGLRAPSEASIDLGRNESNLKKLVLGKGIEEDTSNTYGNNSVMSKLSEKQEIHKMNKRSIDLADSLLEDSQISCKKLKKFNELEGEKQKSDGAPTLKPRMQDSFQESLVVNTDFNCKTHGEDFENRVEEINDLQTELASVRDGIVSKNGCKMAEPNESTLKQTPMLFVSTCVSNPDTTKSLSNNFNSVSDLWPCDMEIERGNKKEKPAGSVSIGNEIRENFKIDLGDSSIVTERRSKAGALSCRVDTCHEGALFNINDTNITDVPTSSSNSSQFTARSSSLNNEMKVMDKLDSGSSPTGFQPKENVSDYDTVQNISQMKIELEMKPVESPLKSTFLDNGISKGFCTDEQGKEILSEHGSIKGKMSLDPQLLNLVSSPCEAKGTVDSTNCGEVGDDCSSDRILRTSNDIDAIIEPENSKRSSVPTDNGRSPSSQSEGSFLNRNGVLQTLTVDDLISDTSSRSITTENFVVTSSENSLCCPTTHFSAIELLPSVSTELSIDTIIAEKTDVLPKISPLPPSPPGQHLPMLSPLPITPLPDLVSPLLSPLALASPPSIEDRRLDGANQSLLARPRAVLPSSSARMLDFTSKTGEIVSDDNPKILNDKGNISEPADSNADERRSDISASLSVNLTFRSKAANAVNFVSQEKGGSEGANEKAENTDRDANMHPSESCRRSQPDMEMPIEERNSATAMRSTVTTNVYRCATAEKKNLKPESNCSLWRNESAKGSLEVENGDICGTEDALELPKADEQFIGAGENEPQSSLTPSPLGIPGRKRKMAGAGEDTQKRSLRSRKKDPTEEKDVSRKSGEEAESSLKFQTTKRRSSRITAKAEDEDKRVLRSVSKSKVAEKDSARSCKSKGGRGLSNVDTKRKQVSNLENRKRKSEVQAPPDSDNSRTSRVDRSAVNVEAANDQLGDAEAEHASADYMNTPKTNCSSNVLHTKQQSMPVETPVEEKVVFRELLDRDHKQSEVEYAQYCLACLENIATPKDVVQKFSTFKNISSATSVVSAIISHLKLNSEDNLMPLYRRLGCSDTRSVETRSLQDGKSDVVDLVGEFSKRPEMTKVEQSVVRVVAECMKVPHLNTILKLLLIRLPKAILSEARLPVVLSLSRLFTALSCGNQATERYKEFMIDVACSKTLSHLQHFLLISCYCVWPKLFSGASDPREISNKKGNIGLHCVLFTVQAIASWHVSKDEHSLEHQALQKIFHWPLTKEDVLDNLCSVLLDCLENEALQLELSTKAAGELLGPVANDVIKSFELLSRCNGWKWCNNTLIGDHLWNIFRRWSQQLTAKTNVVSRNVSNATIATAIRLIGIVSQLGLEVGYKEFGTIFKMCYGILSRASQITSISPLVQLASAYTLLDISSINPQTTSSQLSSWLKKTNCCVPDELRLKILAIESQVQF